MKGILSVVILLVATVSQAFSGEFDRKFYAPYCGIYCVHSALKVSGQDIDFKSLLKPEYVSTRQGSTFADLKQSLKDNGFYSEAVKRMTVSDLKNTDKLVILHIRKRYGEKYDHYSLFLGQDGGNAIVLNPPNPIERIPFSELAPLWSGDALLISKDPIKEAEVLQSSKIRILCYMAVALLGIGIYHLLSRMAIRSELYQSVVKDSIGFKIGVSVAQATVILALVFVGSVTYQTLAPGGLLASSNTAVEGTKVAYAGSFIPKMSISEVQRIIGGDALIIDARFKGDYDAGHLEGAVNIPVSSSAEQVSKIMDEYPKEIEIVVYCQSAGCPYAQAVSQKLSDAGYENASIFKGGYNEWVKGKDKHEK